MFIKNLHSETALVVQWLRLRAPKAGGSTPDGGTRIPQAAWHGLAKERKVHCASPPLSVEGALAMADPDVKPPRPHGGYAPRPENSWASPHACPTSTP